MKSPSKILRSGALISLGQGGSQGCAFLRNLIIARMLDKNDFGIAMTFTISLALMEMITYIQADRYLVQSPKGNRSRLQGTVHTFQLIRGLFCGAAIYLLAGPLTKWFQITEAQWAFQCVAIIPVLRGLSHTDTARLQRKMVFLPAMLVEFVPIFVTTIAAFPLAYIWNDFRLLLYLNIAQAVGSMAMSHMLAKRPFHLCWDRGLFGGVWGFGWPLILQGLCMFGIQEGERVLLASRFQAKELLADFTIALKLTLLPGTLIARIGGTVFMPPLSRAQADAPRFAQLYQQVFGSYAVACMALVVPMWICGDAVVGVLYGAKYQQTGSLLGALAVLQGIRILSAAAVLICMSRGDTVCALKGGMARLLSLPVAIVLFSHWPNLMCLIGCAIGGECLRLAYCVGRIHRLHAQRLAAPIQAVMVVVVSVVVGMLGQEMCGLLSPWARIGMGGLITAMMCGGTFLVLLGKNKASSAAECLDAVPAS